MNDKKEIERILAELPKEQAALFKKKRTQFALVPNVPILIWAIAAPILLFSLKDKILALGDPPDPQRLIPILLTMVVPSLLAVGLYYVGRKIGKLREVDDEIRQAQQRGNL